MHVQQTIGIDAGGTLIKIAIRTKDGLKFQIFSANNLTDCVNWLAVHYPHVRLCVTGGRAERLAEQIHSQHLIVIPEFDATLNGTHFLLRQNESINLSDYLLVNVGTGTSLFAVHRHKAERIGGSGVGGGTLLGLSALLFNQHSFDAIIRLGEKGRRDRVDQTVASIYEGAVPPISGDLTASNFGRTVTSNDLSPTDQAAAVIGLVAETVCTIAIFAAQKEKLTDIVYIGSTLSNNLPMRQIIEPYAHLCGIQSHFLTNGSYCGAIGALSALDDR